VSKLGTTARRGCDVPATPTWPLTSRRQPGDQGLLSTGFAGR